MLNGTLGVDRDKGIHPLSQLTFTFIYNISYREILFFIFCKNENSEKTIVEENHPFLFVPAYFLVVFV